MTAGTPAGMTGSLPCPRLFSVPPLFLAFSAPLSGLFRASFWPFPRLFLAFSVPLLAFSAPLLAFPCPSSGLFRPSSGLPAPSSGLPAPSSGLFRASFGLFRPLLLSFPRFLAGIQSTQSCSRGQLGVISLRQGEHDRRVGRAMVSGTVNAGKVQQGKALDSRLRSLDRNRQGQALGMTEGGLFIWERDADAVLDEHHEATGFIPANSHNPARPFPSFPRRREIQGRARRCRKTA